jgi:hypothetical protein
MKNLAVFRGVKAEVKAEVVVGVAITVVSST